MATDWCPFARKRAIVNTNFTAGRGGQKMIAVVLHIAAGNLEGVYQWFNNPASKVSAHFCVGKDGTIDQYVSVNDTAYANGLAWQNGEWQNALGKKVTPTWQDIIPQINPNRYTVSIEHEGFPQDTWTPAMHAANNRLLVWLAEQFELALVPQHSLIGHGEINPLDKANCPGPHVEYARSAVEVATLRTAKQFTWMPINTAAALYRFAQERDLGYPQTDEFETTFEGETYLAQVFNLGIVYVKKGDWENAQWVKKPEA